MSRIGPPLTWEEAKFERRIPTYGEKEKIRFAFGVASVDEDTRERTHAVRALLFTTAEKLCQTIPDCREQRVALLKLEEASFWAYKALFTRGESNE